MAVKTYIEDPDTKIRAAVVDVTGETNALVVATIPLIIRDNKLKFFISDDYGSDMNINTAAGGTPEKVHDGIDSALWTASDIIGGGKSTFNSTDQNHTDGGAQSVKIDNAPIGDVFQFAKGSNLDCNNYVSITMWIYVDKDWKIGDNIELYGWNTNTGTQVGIRISLQDYFNYNTYDVWQKITIPLRNMNLSTSVIDALRVDNIAAEGKSPKYYLDDIQFEETGTVVEYILRPRNGTWLYVDSFQIIFADGYDGTLADASMAKIPYDSFFGVPELDTGIIYRRTVGDEIISSANIRKFIDFMGFSNAKVTGSGTDGTNTWASINVKFNTSVILKAEDLDKMSLVVSDDLSGLLLLRVGAGCREEARE